MSAGGSAWSEATRQLALSEAHALAAASSRTKAANYFAAADSEKRIAHVLAPLAAAGYHFLPDRQWPGSRRAQVDMVIVGPGGLFIVDTKAWKDPIIAAGRIFRGQADVTDEFDGLADLAWKTEAALAEIGLAPGEVRPVVVFAGHKGVNASIGGVEIVGEGDIVRHIARRGQRLTASAVEQVLAAAMTYFPLIGAPAPVDVTLPEPIIGPEPALDLDHLPSESDIEAAILEGLLAPPIEEWMTFLHPDQAKLVRRSFNGPSRIRGAAGTGKTVVGLHRAAYLARSQANARVLVTTFVRTLPDVLSNLLGRMAPDVAGRVEFSGVHQFARKVLAERGIDVRVNRKLADQSFAEAWKQTCGPLTKIDTNSRFWREELDHVIKGRGLTTFDEYADCARIGRRRRLTLDQRRSVWALYQRYESLLRTREVHDDADLILLAEAALRAKPMVGYTAVIVDEAQDLSCAMIRMLASVAGDGADAFTLIGDGQQTIYPGGYTLAEAGLSVAGRGVIMDVNYRNTAEILALAVRVVDGASYVDIEGTAASAAAITSPRHGERPLFARARTRTEHDGKMLQHIRRAAQSVSVGWGDVGVLCSTNWQVRDAVTLLRTAGIPVVELTDYDGSPTDAVKVGTIKRAKGLEFKQVLLPWITERLMFPGVIGAGWTDSQIERDERDRRELFVGITRARDGVWVGCIAAQPPSA
ncbi:UvrD-helicase domain-containing protein [Cryobacterium sp. RTC2.1]|uniref:nuclease-related domain-containing DEAD/DEAH box helicase n=1 Tax=Cryobacterium sp. RTC2.1 TaxID=3048634 RepID=UPI002B22ACDF|nr:UvrD-helicase domain-containing protein [Cryobacterium sp. RTC2.1]MEB0001904.1 UvrD-helicase domain-containing protein [Cryobacterium sp. RTC2.1]